ncbi:MAG: hypothetical protein D6698_10310 [Gammaproteobacteria bacterium]|nr:MAG: hypothetical protein D6698_10310 [Gammaproteobacteria bacterium]
MYRSTQRTGVNKMNKRMKHMSFHGGNQTLMDETGKKVAAEMMNKVSAVIGCLANDGSLTLLLSTALREPTGRRWIPTTRHMPSPPKLSRRSMQLLQHIA